MVNSGNSTEGKVQTQAPNDKYDPSYPLSHKPTSSHLTKKNTPQNAGCFISNIGKWLSTLLQSQQRLCALRRWRLALVCQHATTRGCLCVWLVESGGTQPQNV